MPLYRRRSLGYGLPYTAKAPNVHALHALLVNEFVRSPVPDTRTTTGWRIAAVKIGVVIALPAFLTGAEIGAKLGFAYAALAIFGGCLILAVLCCLTGTVAAKSRLPTAVITQFAFGSRGAKVVNLVLATTLVGWFAVTVELFAQTLGEVISRTLDTSLDDRILMLGGGAAMVATTVFGFGGLSLLAKWTVPLMVLLLVAMAYLTATDSTLNALMAAPPSTTSLGIAISAVVGGPAAGTVIFPDISRFARSPGHGRGAALLSYGIGMPLVLVLVALTALATGEKELVLVMIGLGLGIPALVFLVLVAWTTNAGNLYSGSIFLSAVLPVMPQVRIVVIGGCAGILVALLGITDYFVPFLVALGIAVPPLAGIYVADFFGRGQRYDVDAHASLRPWHINALASWLFGIGIGYASVEGLLTLTGIPACDSIAVSAATFLLLRRMTRNVLHRQSR